MTDTTSSERTVWLIRHGSRMDVFDPHWLEGAPRRHDPPLAPLGIQQARETGVFLAGQNISHIFTSPFLRAVETAFLINEQLGLPLKVEQGLSEALFEEWFPYRPGFMPMAVLAQLFPGIDLSYTTAITPAYPETPRKMLARASRTIQRLLRRHHGNLVLVGHGGSLPGFCWGLVDGNPYIHPTLCCLVKLTRRNGEWLVEKDGTDTSHLSRSDTGRAQATEAGS